MRIGMQTCLGCAGVWLSRYSWSIELPLAEGFGAEGFGEGGPYYQLANVHNVKPEDTWQ